MSFALAWISVSLLAGDPATAQPAAAAATERPATKPRGKAPTAPVTPGVPPSASDTPQLQSRPPTGTLERVPPSGVVPAPVTGDEQMEKPAPSTGPNSIPTAPDAATPPKPKPAPSAAPP